MKRLTEQEIKFIKETGWCPTIYQMGYSQSELQRSVYKDLSTVNAIVAFQKKANELGVNETKLYEKCTEENDGISLEYEASYLFYTFFTKEQLEKLTDEEATKWLQDFQYYLGYRKWDNGNMIYVQEALDVYEGRREFYETDDGAVWNREKEDN